MCCNLALASAVAAFSNLIGGVVGPPWLERYAGSVVAGGLKPEQYNAFCELILTDEMARCGAGGVVWGIFGLFRSFDHASRAKRDSFGRTLDFLTTD